MSEEVKIKVTWDYDSAGLEKLKGDVESAKEKVNTATGTMDVSYRRLASSISHIATAGTHLTNVWEQVAKGQIGIAEAVVSTIPAIMSLAASIWTLVSAEKARTIASSIAHAVTSLGAALPLLVAAVAAGTAMGLSAIATIPSREYGGRIWQTGPYLLHAGETVSGGSRTVNIYYPQFRSRSEMDELIGRLRAAGVI